MASSLFASILAFILLLGPSAIVAGQDQSTCNRNGGNLVVFENRACADLNYTFTEWCNVVDGSDGCQVTAKSCGCKYYDENGYASSVGSGSKHCANACVDISSDVPEDGSCNAQGSAVSWNGRCDSRNYTYTPQCSFQETTDSQNNVLTCTVTAKSCGCLWWGDDADYISGVNYDGKRSCDACAVYGMENDMPSNGSGMLQVVITIALISFGSLSTLIM